MLLDEEGVWKYGKCCFSNYFSQMHQNIIFFHFLKIILKILCFYISWYLQWFAVLASSVIKTTMEKVKPKLVSASSVPLLRLLLPKTETNAIGEIDKLLVSPQVSG
jgi:anaphase-promoting complex subunit 1